MKKKGAEQKSSRSCLKGAQERKGIKKSRKQQKRRGRSAWAERSRHDQPLSVGKRKDQIWEAKHAMIRHERAVAGGNWRSSQDQVTTDIKHACVSRERQKQAEISRKNRWEQNWDKKGAEQKSSRSGLKGAQEPKGTKKGRKKQKRTRSTGAERSIKEQKESERRRKNQKGAERIRNEQKEAEISRKEQKDKKDANLNL